MLYGNDLKFSALLNNVALIHKLSWILDINFSSKSKYFDALSKYADIGLSFFVYKGIFILAAHFHKNQIYQYIKIKNYYEVSSTIFWVTKSILKPLFYEKLLLIWRDRRN